MLMLSGHAHLLRRHVVGPEVVYLNGTIVPAAEARVSVFDRGFLFGDGVYELVRTFEGIPLAMNAHVARLKASLASIQLDAFDAEEYRRIVDVLLEATGLANADIYLQISRGASTSRQHVPTENMSPTVLGIATAGPSIDSLKCASRTTAVTAPDHRWQRCDIKAITLLPNILAAMEANASGASEAILLRDGFVSEGTHSNVLIVANGTVLTPPLAEGHSILQGTMRGLATSAATDLGIPIAERRISRLELENADEIALTSSRKIMHLVETLDGKSVPMGEIFEQIFIRMRDSIQQVIDNNANALPAAR
jgi:D-alanine transaminase